jgi:mortality factor 4-like protein 1
MFYYGHYHEVTNCNLRTRSKKSHTKVRIVEEIVKDAGDDDSDELSPLFDDDLSTYATMRTDEASLEQIDDQEPQDKSFLDGCALVDAVDKKEMRSPKFKVLQKVYVCDKDGVMYLATIRRHLFGPEYQKQIDMGLVMSEDEVSDVNIGEDPESSWHYFVHYDSWNVNFDRWVSEHDVHAISDDVIAVAERISKEHRSLQLEMRKNLKGKKLFQTIEGTSFLREWKKRLSRILVETKFRNHRNVSEGQLKEPSQETYAESDQPSTKLMRKISWTQAAISNEKMFREQGLTTTRIQNNSIVLPFVLKKILVQQWEYINQCRMMPCIPASVPIRQALNRYLESKNVDLQKTGLSTQPTGQDATEFTVSGDCKVSEKVLYPEEAPTKEDRDQEWRDMADGIAMLFDEALESRLLYREEIPQLRSIYNIPEYSQTPYSELYGCEHLLRLFVRLPEMLSDNLPDEEVRPIVAKVNDFVRFLHKNQGSLLTQTHRKLNESELKEQKLICRDQKV